jgi:hypothetical protein
VLDGPQWGRKLAAFVRRAPREFLGLVCSTAGLFAVGWAVRQVGVGEALSSVGSLSGQTYLLPWPLVFGAVALLLGGGARTKQWWVTVLAATTTGLAYLTLGGLHLVDLVADGRFYLLPTNQGLSRAFGLDAVAVSSDGERFTVAANRHGTPVPQP